MTISLESKFSDGENWFSVRPSYHNSPVYGEESKKWQADVEQLSSKKFDTAEKALKAADEFAAAHNGEKKKSHVLPAGITNDEVRQWSGDEYSDEKINSVIEQMHDASLLTDAELKVKSGKGAWAHEMFAQTIDAKAKLFSKDIREGLLHKDMSKEDAKKVIWGILMAFNS
jgi:hypothetical protein